MELDTDTAEIELPEMLTGWRGECPICRDNLYFLSEQDGTAEHVCLGCGAHWWHRPLKWMRNTPPVGWKA